MWKIIILCICLGRTTGQDYLRTYPLRGGSSPSAEERYLKPEPLVLANWGGDDVRSTYTSTSTRVFWPFEKAPSLATINSQNPVSSQVYGQQETVLLPLKNTISAQIYSINNENENLAYPAPASAYNVLQDEGLIEPKFSTRLGQHRPYLRRPKAQVIDLASTNSPGPIENPIRNSNSGYTNYVQVPQSTYRPNYYDPNGINYAPIYKNYIPITRYHHSMKPETGEYNVGFETANGISQQEIGYTKQIPVYNFELGRYEERSGSVKTGKVSWTSPEGIPFSFSYIADEMGFRHIPSADSSQKSTSSQLYIPDHDLNSYKPIIPYNPIRTYQ